MNSKAILEIGEIICVTRSWNFRKLAPEEIVCSEEYRMFKLYHPELCKLVEGDGDE